MQVKIFQTIQSLLARLGKNNAGSELIEYGVLAACIALASIAALMLCGIDIRTELSLVASKIQGNSTNNTTTITITNNSTESNDINDISVGNFTLE